MTVTQPFSETDDPEQARQWLRNQLAILERTGLLPNLHGDGRVRGNTESAPARGAVPVPALETDCGIDG